MDDQNKSQGPIINKTGASKLEEAESILEEFRQRANQPEEVEAKAERSSLPDEEKPKTKIFALRTTANREEQVLAFVASNAARKKISVYSVIAPHGMRGYIFL